MTRKDQIKILDNKIKSNINQYKVDRLNKFENDMENNINNLDKKLTDKENNLHAKLNKLRNNGEKTNKYIKENNDKKVSTKKN